MPLPKEESPHSKSGTTNWLQNSNRPSGAATKLNLARKEYSCDRYTCWRVEAERLYLNRDGQNRHWDCIC